MKLKSRKPQEVLRALINATVAFVRCVFFMRAFAVAVYFTGKIDIEIHLTKPELFTAS